MKVFFLKPNGTPVQIFLAPAQINAFNGLFGVSGKLIFVVYCAAVELRRKSPARSFHYKSVFRAAQTQKITGGPPAEHVGWFEGVDARARRRGWLVRGLGAVPPRAEVNVR